MGNTPSTEQRSADKRDATATDAATGASGTAGRGTGTAAGTRLAPPPNEPMVTHHKPGHLYSHSINLPGPPADDGQSPGRRLHRIRDGRALNSETGSIQPDLRAVQSDLSFVGRTGSPALSDSSHTSGSTSGRQAADSASESESGAPGGENDSSGSHLAVPGFSARTGFRFPPIRSDLEPSEAEPAARTPRASTSGAEGDPPTPRAETGQAPAEAEDVPAAAGAAPTATAARRGRYGQRASLIFDDAPPRTLSEPTSPEDGERSSAFDAASSEVAANAEGSRARPALNALPSYLKIPTTIPRAYEPTSASPSERSGLRAPMLADPRGGKASTAVHYEDVFAHSADAAVPSWPSAGPPVGAAPPPPPPPPPAITPGSAPAGIPIAAPRSSVAHAPEPQAPGLVPGAPNRVQPSTPPANPEALRLSPVKLAWHGRGHAVSVTGTFAHEWRGKIPLRQTHPGDAFTCTLHLPPGTHRLKFIVDDRWRVSHELNTATDGDGNLVNYVEVPAAPRRDPEDADVPPPKAAAAAAPDAQPVAEDARAADPAWAHAMAELQKQHHNPEAGARGDWEELLDEAAPRKPDVHWTSEVPRAVEIAQETEEALIEHEMAADAPALLPNPPILPRQLEKVIMNSSPANVNGHINAPASVVDDNSVLPAPNHAVLNHLSASAIKNGVLAVGVVTRYKRKYVTTLLYRPVRP